MSGGTRAPTVIVVGAGVIGVNCAYYLARRGAAVTVLERDAVGSGASLGNAGAIAPGHGPLNKPGRVRQALRSLGRPTSPLYVAPRWDPSLARWLWTFARHCSAEHHRRGTEALLPLSRATLPLFDELMEREALECAYQRDGYLEAFRTEPGAAAAREEAAHMRQRGFASQALSATELRDHEPALAEDVVGGLFHADAATLDPHRFVVELAARTERLGATVRPDCPVREVRLHNGRVTGVVLETGETVDADAVILAAGAHTVQFARRLGIALPLQPAKGYHTDHRVGPGGAPSLRRACLLGEPYVFATPMGDFMRIAGTLEFSGINHQIRRPRLEQLTRAGHQFLRSLGESPPVSEWCGLRPCLPDGLPAIGSAPGYRGLFVATGHAMLGLTLGPVTGKLVAECVLEGSPSLDWHALRVERF